jgi:hypothetical protein
MSKNRGKSKLSKTVLFNANKHVFHCEKSLGTLVYGQPSSATKEQQCVSLQLECLRLRFISLQITARFEIMFSQLLIPIK